MQNKRLIIAALALVLIVGGAYLAINYLPESPLPTPAPEPAPDGGSAFEEAVDFTMADREGHELTLASLRGKPVLLNFWASWCGPCQIEMPHFEAAFEVYGDDIEFVMLNMLMDPRETPDKAEAFIAEHGYTFPVYSDHLNEAAVGYGVASIPRTYAIDAEGRLVAQYLGTMDGDKLDQFIQNLLLQSNNI